MHDQPIIRAAGFEDAAPLTQLYIAYRVFYGEPPSEQAAEQFIRERLTDGGARYFLAWLADSGTVTPAGFMHLMPSTNTLAMRAIWLLEDLYVESAFRGRGVGTALLRYAEEFAHSTGAERLTLATAKDNATAQAIYQKLGYVREEHFWYFHRVLG
jgi:GNAT superfamily N-acetyltransferase